MAVGSFVWAILNVGLDDLDKAMEWLWKAYEERDPPLLYIQCEHYWDELRFRADYKELIRKMGFPPA